MTAGPELSPLERERFGIVTARWDEASESGLAEALAFCQAQGVELLIARCEAGAVAAVHALERAGALLMDTLVSYARTLDGVPVGLEDGASRVRIAGPEDAAAVGEVAGRAFLGYASHYHADPRLDARAADAVYPDWAVRSCADPGVADAVLVAGRDGAVEGFLTLRRRDGEEAEIVLNAVDPSAQRRGVYRTLLAAALDWSHGHGMRRISVRTQLVNRSVQAAWLQAGFVPTGAWHTFHLWTG